MQPGFGSWEVCLDFSIHCHDCKEWKYQPRFLCNGYRGLFPRDKGWRELKAPVTMQNYSSTPQRRGGGMLAAGCPVLPTEANSLVTTRRFNPANEPYFEPVQSVSQLLPPQTILIVCFALQISLFPKDLHPTSRCSS
jgi:hypothetical protein